MTKKIHTILSYSFNLSRCFLLDFSIFLLIDFSLNDNNIKNLIFKIIICFSYFLTSRHVIIEMLCGLSLWKYTILKTDNIRILFISNVVLFFLTIFILCLIPYLSYKFIANFLCIKLILFASICIYLHLPIIFKTK